jgi:hypothetical protein
MTRYDFRMMKPDRFFDERYLEMPPRYRYRSAITGRFVRASYAKRYPHLTVRETY